MQAVVPSAVAAAVAAAIIIRSIKSKTVFLFIVVGIWMMYYVSNKKGREHGQMAFTAVIWQCCSRCYLVGRSFIPDSMLSPLWLINHPRRGRRPKVLMAGWNFRPSHYQSRCPVPGSLMSS